MRWLCILVAGAAIAQTAPPRPASPAGDPPADKTAARTPSAAELMRASIEKQQASVRKQAQSVGAQLMPWTPSPFFDGPEADCDPLAAEVVTPLIENAAKANSLPAPLIRAVIEQESAYRPCAVSHRGAEGLMQLMPDTADDLNVKDVFDPKENIGAGTKYLKQLLDRYKGDRKLALAAYNAGPGAVDASKGVPDIQETRNYVDAILKKVQ